MLAIRNTMQRVFAMASLLTIKDALLRACRTQPPQRIHQPDSVAGTPPAEDLYVAEDDPEEAFAEWEADRNERLHQVQNYEKQGLDLLGKAALLRAALQCDDRGETFLAEELREQADAIGSTTGTEVPSDTWESPGLDVVSTNDVPAQAGA